jgi:hypothetical protein
MNLVEEAQETSDEMIWGASSLGSARDAALGTGVLQPKSFALAVHSNSKNKNTNTNSSQSAPELELELDFLFCFYSRALPLSRLIPKWLRTSISFFCRSSSLSREAQTLAV